MSRLERGVTSYRCVATNPSAVASATRLDHEIQCASCGEADDGGGARVYASSLALSDVCNNSPYGLMFHTLH